MLSQEPGRHNGCLGVSVVNFQQAMRRHGVGLEIPSLQCILVATAKPEVTLFSHVLGQIQGGEVQSIIAGLRDEYLPTVKLPGIVAGDTKHTVNGIVRMVTVEVWPKDGVPPSGIPEKGRIEERAHVGQGIVVRV